MKKITGYMAVIICLVCISSFHQNVFAQEEESLIVVDKIMEIGKEPNIIQVRDRNYIVKSVYVDNGVTKEPQPALFRDLEVGNLVEVESNGKKGDDGLWRAKKVTLLTGEKENNILKEKE